MAQQSAGFHEGPDLLKPATMDRHRAIVSLMEELEAVDWYDQRVDAATNDELRSILAHNRDEEKEHAAMMLEWLRRHDAGFDAELRTYLFTEKPVLEVEEHSQQTEAAAGLSTDGGISNADGSLGIGSLRGKAR